MHWTQSEAGSLDAERTLTLIEQTPGELLFLSAADTDLAAVAAAWAERFGDRLRIAPAGPLRQPVAADDYVENVLRHARLVVARLLGGESYFPHLLQALADLRTEARRPRLLLLSGSDQPDEELTRLSDYPAAVCAGLFRLFREGGPANLAAAAEAVAALLAADPAAADAAVATATMTVPAPVPMPDAGVYRRTELAPATAAAAAAVAGTIAAAPAAPPPRAWVLFYRAWHQAGDLAVADALHDALAAAGFAVVSFYAFSLRAPGVQRTLRELAREAPPDLLLTTQSFTVGAAAAASAAAAAAVDPAFLESFGCPVLQVPVTAVPRAAWSAAAGAGGGGGGAGLPPAEVAMNVALPEIDGRVLATVAGFREEERRLASVQLTLRRLRPDPAQVDFVARLARNWVRLRRTPNAAKRVALVLANYPNRDGRIGNAVGLDTPASAVRLLAALRADGYLVDPLPASGEELMAWLGAGVTNDPEGAAGKAPDQSLEADRVAAWIDALPGGRAQEMARHWPGWFPSAAAGGEGAAPAAFPVAGRRLGHVFVGVQPPRGFSLQTSAIYHSPDLPPPPVYLAFYLWLRERFGADAVIHLGKHGNLEWLPGRGVGLGPDDYPQACLGPTPHVYPFIVNNPGEGVQAKRRAGAVIVDHLTPPIARAGLYAELAAAERLLEEHAHAAALYPVRAGEIARELEELLARAPWRDEVPPPAPGGSRLEAVGNFLCEVKESQIRSGLHVLGAAPQGERQTDFLLSLLRAAGGASPGLLELLAAPGEVPGEPLTGARRDALEARARAWVEEAAAGGQEPPPAGEPAGLGRLRRLVQERLVPALAEGCPRELGAVLDALRGRFVPPGPAGAPTRGRLDVLPTGRNFYALDPRLVPTPSAWRCGRALAERLLARHRQEHGAYPRKVALVVWGTANLRTGGDDVAQALWLWGCEPLWDEGSGRLRDFRVLPAAVLGRPRVDVVLRVSGLFRDAFGDTLRLLATVPKRLAALDEPPADNFVRAAFLRDCAQLRAGGWTEAQASRRAALRVFSSGPGCYGTGLLPLLDAGNWETRADLTAVFCRWGSHAYAADGAAEEVPDWLRTQLAGVEAVHQNQDNREHDILDSDDYFQFQGGLQAAVTVLRGAAPASYHGDSSMPDAPRVRTLREELVRVLRSRVLNPRWLAAMRAHGYKGAFEVAATVDYLFGYGATTDFVDDTHYEEVARGLLLDPVQQAFFRRHNPAALREAAERLLEAAQRGLWRHPDPGTTAALEQTVLEVGGLLE